MRKRETATLAEGEQPLPKLPNERRSGREWPRHAAITGLGALVSIGPVRRTARKAYHTTLSIVWRRYRAKTDARYGK